MGFNPTADCATLGRKNVVFSPTEPFARGTVDDRNAKAQYTSTKKPKLCDRRMRLNVNLPQLRSVVVVVSHPALTTHLLVVAVQIVQLLYGSDAPWCGCVIVSC